MIELFLARYVYGLVLILLAIGLYGVLAKTDLVKKVIGLTIFSTAIYLFFIEGSLQEDGTAPVIDARGSDPALYVDPVPHLLILTAIVVGVGVIGVALALLVRIYRVHGTFDETVIAERLATQARTQRADGHDGHTGHDGHNGNGGHAGHDGNDGHDGHAGHIRENGDDGDDRDAA
jgi:multicomponent Na+:H+ antiporter subunit C